MTPALRVAVPGQQCQDEDEQIQLQMSLRLCIACSLSKQVFAQLAISRNISAELSRVHNSDCQQPSAQPSVSAPVEERHAGLAGHRPRQQRLAGARGPGQQHALRQLPAQPALRP